MLRIWVKNPAVPVEIPVVGYSTTFTFFDIEGLMPVKEYSPLEYLDPTSLTSWNEFLNLPTNGTPYTSIDVVGNAVTLSGGSGVFLSPTGDGFYEFYNIVSVVDTGAITSLKDELFDNISGNYLDNVVFPAVTAISDRCFNNCQLITSITDTNFETATSIGVGSFGFCYGLITLSLPLVETIGGGAMKYCSDIETISIPACTSLGESVLDNDVFDSFSGQTITLTVPSALMTCNAGSPDGDIAYLQANNTVTVITV